MKKIYLLLIAFLCILPQSFAQGTSDYNEHLSWLFYDDGTLNYGALLLNRLIVWLFLVIIYYLISRFETTRHLKDVFPKEGQKFLYVAFIVCIILRGIFWNLGGWGLLIGRIILAFCISSDGAKDLLGRSKLLWWILSFIEPNVALLILANVPKLVRVKGEDRAALESIFAEYDNKLDNLESLRLFGVLEGMEYKNKRETLDNLYMSKRDEFLEEKDLDTSTIISQLEKAYEDGILTQEEFESKKKGILGDED